MSSDEAWKCTRYQGSCTLEDVFCLVLWFSVYPVIWYAKCLSDMEVFVYCCFSSSDSQRKYTQVSWR